MAAFYHISQAGAVIAANLRKLRKPFLATLPMLIAAATLIAATPTAEAARMGVYVMAAIFGLLVSGLVSIAKEMRGETAHRP